MPLSTDGTSPQQTHLQRWLKITTQQKREVYSRVYETAEMSSFSYWLEIVFSAGIAVLGLVLNSPAVIIGAMLISPLMGPIMATGLALSTGDLYLAMKALANLAASVSLAIGFSAFFVWLLPFHSVTSEILARTNPNLLDLGIALFSGLAGSVAVCRSGGGNGVTTLPGVAIAVALMPPLCTIGFGLGDGANTRIMGGAGLLFLTNLVAIVTSAFAVFLLVGMNSPEVRAEMEQSRKGELLAQRLLRGPFARVIANGGQLRWRVLILAVLLATIAVPLRNAFMQVAGEALVRGAVQDAVKRLVPPGMLVSQQVEVGRESVAVRLIATKSIPDEMLREAERQIERRSGRKAEVSLASVASKSELAELMQHFSTPPQPAAITPEKSLDEIHKDIIDRIQPVIEAAWPPERPLQTFDVEFSPSGIKLVATYASDRTLDKISLQLIGRELKDKLGVETIELKALRVSPTRNRIADSKTKKN